LKKKRDDTGSSKYGLPAEQVAQVDNQGGQEALEQVAKNLIARLKTKNPSFKGSGGDSFSKR
jgi:hypothetical protein